LDLIDEILHIGRKATRHERRADEEARRRKSERGKAAWAKRREAAANS
jgi:hypothetical protein